MKQLIKDKLEDVAKGQPNLESDAAREVVANLIVAGIKSSNIDDKNENVKLDTAGYPVKKIDEWLTSDIDKAVEIDKEK